MTLLAMSALLLTTVPPGTQAAPAVTGAANLELVGEFALPGTLSVRFSSREPVAYAYARQDTGVVVTLDVSDPTRPRELGRVAVPAPEYMEDMDLGERHDGTTFVLVRADDRGLQIVDVTRPKRPRLLGRVTNNVHTWTCVTSECYYAYGNTTRTVTSEFVPPHAFPIVDLTDLSRPVATGTAPRDFGFHDWNSDPAGVMWGAGRNGVYAFDASDPRNPVLVNSSDGNGPFRPDNSYNDRLHLHGTMRPNADRFTADDPVVSVDRGNVLLMSEEGNDVDCTDSFQTWHVPHLDATRLEGKNPLGGGAITPLDSWNLLDDTVPGLTRPAAPDFCSVHWFDYHQDGFVALPAYGAGTRVLDIRDPRNIREVGYYFATGHHATQSNWVPQRPGGKPTRMSNLIYTSDPGTPAAAALFTAAQTGGIKIFRVTLPEPPRG